MIIGLCVVNGTVMFAYFYECNPMMNNTITKYDQVFFNTIFSCNNKQNKLIYCLLKNLFC